MTRGIRKNLDGIHKSTSHNDLVIVRFNDSMAGTILQTNVNYFILYINYMV